MIENINKKIILDDLYEIREYYTLDGEVRALINDGCVQSIEYIDENRQNELGYKYFYYYDIPIYLNPNGYEYLVLGGGAFSYPKYFIYKYENKNMTVVEKNELCIEYANKYFSLNTFINNYDPQKNRLTIIKDDALNYVKICNKTYDYVLIDLFDGKIPTNSLYSDNYINFLKNLLNEKGIIIINYIISELNKENYKIYLKNIIIKFKYYKIISDIQYYNVKYNIGNIIIILSDQEIEIPNNFEYVNLNYIL